MEEVIMNQPFCSPVKALRSVLDAAALLPSPSPETIPLEAACGRIAAADLCARMDQPPFDRSPDVYKRQLPERCAGCRDP